MTPRKARLLRIDFTDAAPFKIDGVYCKLISLGKHLFAIVDAVDYEHINQRKWYAQPRRSQPGFYAVHDAGTSRMYMHREVIDAAAGVEVDHRLTVNTLDNRRANLRNATRAQNGSNRGKQANNSSGYKGVSYHPASGKWDSRISSKGEQHWLGLHSTKIGAALAYDAEAIKRFGEFAVLNFPKYEQLRRGNSS